MKFGLKRAFKVSFGLMDGVEHSGRFFMVAQLLRLHRKIALTGERRVRRKCNYEVESSAEARTSF